MFGDGDGGQRGWARSGGRGARAPIATLGGDDETRGAREPNARRTSPQPSHSSARSYVPTNSLFVACRADSIAPAKRPRRAARAACCGRRRASDGSARAAKKEGGTIHSS